MGEQAEKYNLVFIHVSKQLVPICLPYPGAVPLITKRSRISMTNITATYILSYDQKPALAKGLSENWGPPACKIGKLKYTEA